MVQPPLNCLPDQPFPLSPVSKLFKTVKSRRNRLCGLHCGRATTDVCWCSTESNDPRCFCSAQPADSSNSIELPDENWTQTKCESLTLSQGAPRPPFGTLKSGVGPIFARRSRPDGHNGSCAPGLRTSDPTALNLVKAAKPNRHFLRVQHHRHPACPALSFTSGVLGKSHFWKNECRILTR